MRIEVHLQARDKALAKGDHGQVRAIDADLRRIGYPVPSPAFVDGIAAPPSFKSGDVVPATTATRTRKPRARCEHGTVPDRCVECNPELETM